MMYLAHPISLATTLATERVVSSFQARLFIFQRCAAKKDVEKVLARKELLKA